MAAPESSASAECAEEVYVGSSDGEDDDEDLADCGEWAEDEDLVDCDEWGEEGTDADMRRQLQAALGSSLNQETDCGPSLDGDGLEEVEMEMGLDGIEEEIQVVGDAPCEVGGPEEEAEAQVWEEPCHAEQAEVHQVMVGHIAENGADAHSHVVDEADWQADGQSEGSSSQHWEDELGAAEEGFGAVEGSDDGDLDMNFFVDVEGADEASGEASSQAAGELIRVPAGAREHLLGKDGQTLARLAATSGAELSLVPSGSSKGFVLFSACGSPEAIGVARRLLLNIAAELPKAALKDRRGRSVNTTPIAGTSASVAVGDDRGICKWFAAGFCRNQAPGGYCRNGAHDGQGAQRAETAWVGEAPTAGNTKPAKLPVLLLLDLEGGGNTAGRDGEDEIIEVPVLAMCPVTGSELGRFHRFSRPGFWDRNGAEMRRRRPAHCFNEESTAVPFPQVMQELRTWICKVLCIDAADLRREDFLFVTCGNWDVKTVMPRQCSNPSPGTVDLATQHLLLWRWCNLKDAFREHFELSYSAAPTGMRGMLSKMKIPLAGQHHLGMDDVSNLSKILRKMVLEGAKIEATGYAAGEAPKRPGLLPPQHPGLTPPSQIPAAVVPLLVTSSPEQCSPEMRERGSLKRPVSSRGGVLGTMSEISPPKILRASAAATNPYLLPSGDSKAPLVDVEAEATPFWEETQCSHLPDGGSVGEAPCSPLFTSAPARSARSILAKYSSLHRADEAGHDVRVKKKLMEVAANDTQISGNSDLVSGRTGGKGKGRGSLGVAGGKCRRMQRW